MLSVGTAVLVDGRAADTPGEAPLVQPEALAGAEILRNFVQRFR